METKEDRSDVPKSSTSQSKIISNSNKTPMEAEAKHEHKKEKSHPLKTTTKIPETQPIGESSESFRNSRQHHEQQHSTSTPGHQVIAVSASKGPAAFFNLARKFLATDEYCDLSALEGAIVSAVDAAHLLARSKLAVIVRIQTAYVPVEPKRKSQHDHASEPGTTTTSTSTHLQYSDQPSTSKTLHLSKKTAPLRRSRLIITVKRTVDYERWLEDNPYHTTTHVDDINEAQT